jgi:hypothetical protein
MYFGMKNYLKNNHNHTIKQSLTVRKKTNLNSKHLTSITVRKKTNLNSKHLTSMQQVNVLSSD